MNTAPVKVSVIIVSFNTREILRNCLQSIRRAYFGFSHEIIVIDNNSIDGSAEMVKHEFPHAILVENDHNNLFSKANNQGAAIAQGEYLLLLNSDTLVENGNIEKLAGLLDTSSGNIACAGPVVLNENRSQQSAGYPLPSIQERISAVFHLNRLLPRFASRIILPKGTPGIYDETHRTGWVSGCCMLVRSDVYRMLGGLNEGLEFYGEEPEFCMRLEQNGFETWLVQDASIIHLGGQSSGHEQASFLQDPNGSLRRYAALQQYTVGLRQSIIMSRIVLAAAWLKYALSGNRRREYFKTAISHEQAVIAYMKKLLSGK
ncbi:MAG: glycosyltransferase family 2 protein [Chlorobiaceae bacterium]|nr:glycosyltransferase family 2 protein [Chlorobiaceae bacterium]